MKRSILFIGYDPPVENEISEYMHDQDAKAFFAHTHEQAIRILEAHTVERVVLNLRSMGDAAVMRYIAQYHPGTRVVVSASPEFDELISILSQSTFARMPRPFRLEMLKMIL